MEGTESLSEKTTPVKSQTHKKLSKSQKNLLGARNKIAPSTSATLAVNKTKKSNKPLFNKKSKSSYIKSTTGKSKGVSTPKKLGKGYAIVVEEQVDDTEVEDSSENTSEDEDQEISRDVDLVKLMVN